ncbi:MAG: CBS domain-containing protein [Armatimonadota bacterium]
MSDTTAKDIMNTNVIAVSASTKLNEVVELLATNNISGAPVVDEKDNLIGIISEADLIDQKKREWAIPRLALFGLWRVPDRLLEDSYKEGCNLEARDIMSKKVITAGEDASVIDLAEIMINKRINRIPIVRDNKVIGIVTRTDILKGTCGYPGTTCKAD